MDDLDLAIARHVARAQHHLAFSVRKLDRLRLLDGRAWEEDELEDLDGFAMRFARAADIVTAQFLRRRVLAGDPGFRGTMIDLLNEAEKQAIIASARTWVRIRQLRNVTAHEYTQDGLAAHYRELRQLADAVLAVDAGHAA